MNVKLINIKLLYFIVILWIFSLSLFAQDPSTPSAILQRIDSLIKNEVKQWCESVDITYPPEASLLRVFKKERKMEIWSKNVDMKQMKLVKTLPICSMDFEPGPKFREGDGKTPEGFYSSDFLYGSRVYLMWIKLEEDLVENDGNENNGSSFRMCIDYPNRLDRKKSAAFNQNTGGAICIHGNCVSAGCVSFDNWDFLPVFAFSRHHNSDQFGEIQVHIFPFDFNKVESLEDEALRFESSSYFSSDQLYLFWKNLKEGYDIFNSNPNPLDFQIEIFTLKKGDNSKEIKEIKELLLNLNIYKGEFNSLFDNEFEIAVKIFQRQSNLFEDGVIGPKTLPKMNYITGKYKFIE